jgi:O-methyltransferase
MSNRRIGSVGLVTDRESVSAEVGARDLYLELLKKCLTFWLWEGLDGSVPFSGSGSEVPPKGLIKRIFRQKTNWTPHRPTVSAQQARLDGRDWPVLAHTMIGLKRLDNLQFCLEDVIKKGVPGDVVETGVWRGGATIMMRAVLKAYNVNDRVVWVADSFAGLPAPNASQYPADAGDTHHQLTLLSVSLEEVKANFERYGLLDEQVRFLRGWFKDTLPNAPIDQLAVARLDGDMYESTMDALTALYPKLSAGGYLIVDDYGVVPGCRKAVDDYRHAQAIREPIQDIDGWGVYWQKSA